MIDNRVYMRSKSVLLFLVVAIAFVAASCQTDDLQISKGSDEVQVSFSVDDFRQEVTPMPKAVSAESSMLLYYSYYIYSEGGELVKSGRRSIDDPSYTLLNVYLKPGKYFALFVGNNVVENADSYWKTIVKEPSPSGEASFGATISFIVDSAGSKSHDVVMRRLVGRVEVDIQDQIPENFGSLEVNVLLFPQEYSLSLGKAYKAKSNVKTSFTSRQLLDKKVWFYSFSNSEIWNKELQFTVYSTKGEVISSKRVPNLIVKTNYLTKLTGNMFDGSDIFTVSIDSSWDGTIDN